MFRTLVYMTILCFGCMTAAEQAAAQSGAMASLGDGGTSTSLSDCGNSCGSSCGDGCNSCMPVCNEGCGSGLSKCGRLGGFFNRGGQCADSCCESECGGDCQCDGCQGGMLSRIRGMIPQVDFTFGRNPCPQRYRSIFGGGVQLEDYEGENGGNPITGSFNEGFILGTARGQYLSDKWRIEWESSWRNNAGDVWNNNGNLAPFDGPLNVYSSMGNLIREFSCGQMGVYVGGGIGPAKQKGGFEVMGARFDLNDWAFAYQGFAGVNLFEARKATAFVEYRYYANTETVLDRNTAFFDNFSYESQNIIFGFRLKR